MIDGLLGGVLVKDPETRAAKNGSTYVLATLRVPMGGDAVIFARIMAFSHVKDELQALAKGDPVSVTGALEIGTWKTDTGEVRPSLSVIAHAIVSPYHVKRRRAEVASAQQGAAGRRTERANGAPATTSRSAAPMPDDALDDL
ncbi:single-stranded DNA-binding protein [Paraburkholderia sp. BR10923]|uniref:single-stranded DNA-binding protein n=1 Tax=Paraburkholderia sp. BR10923 TaxID=3236992 RepID=UPI0034CF773A